MSDDALRGKAAGMIRRAIASGRDQIVKLPKKLYVSLSLEDGDLVLDLAREKAPGPSATEIDICRRCFEVPPSAAGDQDDRRYVVRWPVPVRPAAPALRPAAPGPVAGAPAVALSDLWWDLKIYDFRSALRLGDYESARLALSCLALRGDLRD